MEIRAYVDTRDTIPILTWVRYLDLRERKQVLAAIARFEAGNLSDVKSLRGTPGLFERRLRSRSGLRIYFGRDGQTLIILLGGGRKSSQRHDIDSARASWQDYTERKRSLAWNES